MITIDLDTVCDVTFNFGGLFLLEPIGQKGRFENREFWVWSDPEYGGDNTITKYTGNPLHFTMKNFCGRSKGTHSVRGYCGPDVKFS